ncbi:MAG TPA: glycosyltransferase family 4 protein, partial [Phormidium sp.]
QNLNSNLENPRITFCGNGNLRKNPISVAQAFSLLAEKHEKLRLTFAGNVKCIESEIRGVIAPQHQSRLEFKGLLTPEKVADLLNSTTVFCLPSEHESFGMAWVEAMACGVPVVAGAGSCAEEVITKDAGFIIDPHNPRQIAEVIGALLSNSELRSRVGSLGQKVVSDRYSAEVVAVRVLDWYISLLDRKKN